MCVRAHEALENIIINTRNTRQHTTSLSLLFHSAHKRIHLTQQYIPYPLPSIINGRHGSLQNLPAGIIRGGPSNMHNIFSMRIFAHIHTHARSNEHTHTWQELKLTQILRQHLKLKIIPTRTASRLESHVEQFYSPINW